MASEEREQLGVGRTVRRHWLVSVLAFAICLTIGVAAAFGPEKTYRSTATVAVRPSQDTRITGAAIQMANFLIPTFIDEVGSSAYRERVRPTLPVAVRDVAVHISASVKGDGTGLLAISVESAVPEATSAWANALAAALVTAETPAVVAPPPTTVPPRPGDPKVTGTTSTTLGRALFLETLEPAGTPGSPVSPQQAPLLLAAAALGVFAAIFAARTAARLEAGRNRSELVRRHLGLPVLAEIPMVWTWRRRQIPVDQLLSAEHPRTVEAFKNLRVNVELGMLGADGALAVVSSKAGEGKTTVAIGLASSLAFAGHDVVVVDADLRRPSVHRRTGQELSPGVADSNPKNAATHVRPTSVAHLSVLPAGLPQQHPADVIATLLPPAVHAIAEPGRLVVIDSPPFLAAEAMQVAVLAQQVILVVQARWFKIAELETIVDRLRASDVKVLGVVVNQVRRPLKRRKDYYGYEPTSSSAPVEASASS